MIIAKIDDRNIEQLTINCKTSTGEEIQYDVEYFKNLEKLETIALNGFIINNNLIGKLNILKHIKTIVFNHCKFINDDKLENNIQNIIITYSDIENINIIEKVDIVKTIELIGIEDVDINCFMQMKNLIEISIYNSKIINSKKFKYFLNLKFLNLDGSLVDEPNLLDLLDKEIKFNYNEKFYL